MEIRDYLRGLRRHWIAIILMTAVGLGVAYGWSSIQTPVYQASASGYLKTRAVMGEDGQVLVSSPQSDDNYAQSKVEQYKEFATWRSVAQHAGEELGLTVSPEELVRRITVDNPEGTSTLTITASGPTPTEARDLAEAWMRGLVAEIDNLDGTGAAESSPVMIVLGQSASLPQEPTFPDLRSALLVGGVLGVGGGIAFAMIRAVSDRRVRPSDDVEQRLGVPLVGTLPKVDELTGDNRLVAADDTGAGGRGGFAVREALRVLRTNLQFMDVDQPPRIIVVTSALPGEGKSTVAANLALTLAAAGAPVVLVDGDLRRPTVAKTMGLPGGAGVTDVLAGRADIQDVAQRGPSNLVVLTAGTIPPNPSEILGSERMRQLLADLAVHATVIVDAPPLLAVTDGAVLTHQADGALLVVSAGKTTYDLVERSLASLEKVRGRVLGVVLNRVPASGVDSSAYSYEYKSSGEQRRGPFGRRKASPTTDPASESPESEPAHARPAAEPAYAETAVHAPPAESPTREVDVPGPKRKAAPVRRSTVTNAEQRRSTTVMDVAPDTGALALEDLFPSTPVDDGAAPRRRPERD
ncbi:polysaccharide biosynthesis tyrosine autokinase [Microbacterium sp. SD291]|uniref:polysaccharide biosynthesis tyrosine autokinase n=1 Tax=Microbacterium sp. SD291 TaxID=2782007 RepID=UPI001A96E322|nr:polysaccharide biosynthesis tyrosine autokinase [Microbacterium sp. SD291]MBO0980969.1 polysaccharide biosynthesis tyrosine autokinase [Microbacterium sp. SD291]